MLRLLKIGLAAFAVLSSPLLAAGGNNPPVEVPEPGTLGLLAIGVLVLASRRKRA